MREDSIKKIREACYKMVYQWKRDFKVSLQKGTEIPKPITIPQIAKRAGLAPKTIYVDDEYRAIAELNISKTKVASTEDDLLFYDNKKIYSLDEVKSILRGVREENKVKINSLEKIIRRDKEMLYKLEKEYDEVKERNKRYLERIVELESENEYLQDRYCNLNN